MSMIKSEVVSGQSLDSLDFWKDPLIFEFIIMIGYLCVWGLGSIRGWGLWAGEISS